MNVLIRNYVITVKKIKTTDLKIYYPNIKFY